MSNDRVEHHVYGHGDVRLEISRLDGRVLRYCYLSHGDTYMTMPTSELLHLGKCVEDAWDEGLLMAHPIP